MLSTSTTELARSSCLVPFADRPRFTGGYAFGNCESLSADLGTQSRRFGRAFERALSILLLTSATPTDTNAEDGSKGYNKSIAAPQPAEGLAKPPTSKPDYTFSEVVSPEQAILYRLSGDYNSLHVSFVSLCSRSVATLTSALAQIDPSVGKALGFGGVILHGLCSYGFASRAILINAAQGDNSRLEFMSARFSSPVRPGDEVSPLPSSLPIRATPKLTLAYRTAQLETKMWVSEGGKRVDFTQQVKGGKVCLSGGVALLKPAGASKSKL